MTRRLEGRRILVTGAASGMGREIARLFSAQGAALALLDRNGEGVAQVAAAIGARAHQCDVSSLTDVTVAVKAAVDGLGGLDGIVNAAGILVMKPFEELEPESWHQMLGVNLGGPYNIIRAGLQALRQAQQGTIVNIASVSSYLPMPGSSGYSASKGGLVMFTKCLALEFGPRIRCNTVCPGVVRTEMTRYIWENPEHSQRAADRTALKRLGNPEDVAYAALYLTSRESGFTTGTEIVVDGGFSWH
jgi:NAD(P)-dependent dehydrogenase (short-subunit alcohol dehydrogenase family)